MNHIESMHIEGYKKFTILDVDFNENMNIIVGENESGKSTILDAIKTVLNQQYKNADKILLKELFNVDQVKDFERNPSVATLPRVYIEVQLCLDAKGKNSEYFYGEVNRDNKEGFGVSFTCEYNEELGSGLEAEIIDGKIPYEYYSLRWTTFAGMPYQSLKRPFGFLAIDTSNISGYASFNYYNKTLFMNSYEDAQQMEARDRFRNELDQAFDSINLPDIDKNRKFGIDGKRVILENVISVYENNIPLENRGSGMECLIKTQIALNKKKSKIDVIEIEEPENHLSFVNMKKMLEAISEREEDAQIIIATHSSMVASRLNLKNVLWIAESHAFKLSDLKKTTADFFIKADDNNILQVLLSEKLFLVEGATEYLIIPHLYEQEYKRTMEKDGISIVSCNGISYRRYLELATGTNKRIAVITDNDGSEDTIKGIAQDNSGSETTRIFTDPSVDNWTWEKCIYNINKDILNEIIETRPGAQYLYYGECVGKTLGKMLNNKTESAYDMILSGRSFNIPQYVKDAFEWIRR